MARALRFQACIPIRFWGICVSAAVYILNRLPTKLHKGKSSYEVLYGQTHSLSHVRVLGSLCYELTPKDLISLLLGLSLLFIWVIFLLRKGVSYMISAPKSSL